MRIIQLDPHNRRHVETFVRLPFTLYREHPLWVPPLVSQVERALDPNRLAFYRHSQAAFFLAELDGQCVGRIAAVDNRRYNTYRGTATAFFTYFECMDDADVAGGLFAAAFAWARERGLRDILGPRGLVRGDAAGLLIEGFEHPPALGIPYNPSYYVNLLEGAGFQHEMDYLSGLLRGDYRLPERYVQLAERVKERRGWRIKSFDNKAELRAWAPALQRINNESFAQVWGFHPMEDDDLQDSLATLTAIADPKLLKLVLKGDEVVGFLLAFPDLSEGLRRARGRLWPLGWWHLWRDMCRTRRITINGLALLPEHQGLGGDAVLFAELQASLLARGAEWADVAEVAETNAKSLGDMNALGVQWYKRHRVYRRAL